LFPKHEGSSKSLKKKSVSVYLKSFQIELPKRKNLSSIKNF